MSGSEFWRRLRNPGVANSAPAAAIDPFPTWERELDPNARSAAQWRELIGRLVIGTLAGFLITGVTILTWAYLVVHAVFGTAGDEYPTVRWAAASAFGAAVGLFIAYSWPQLMRWARTYVLIGAALVLIVPGGSAYIEARTGQLSYGELHAVAELGGRSVCQMHLKAHAGWPAGSYWMLNQPTPTGTLVTAHGGDSTWLHRYPSPLVCLP